MKYIKSLILTFVIAAGLGSSASAQNASGGSSLQTQNSGAQPTAPVQNNVAPVQNNQADIFSQDQSSSLKVYTSPEQTEAAVEVGASSTTNQPVTVGFSSNNYTFYALAFLGLGLILGIIYLVVRIKYGDEDPSAGAGELEQTGLGPKNDISQESQATKKPKSKTKKKKKKAHR